MGYYKFREYRMLENKIMNRKIYNFVFQVIFFGGFRNIIVWLSKYFKEIVFQVVRIGVSMLLVE